MEKITYKWFNDNINSIMLGDCPKVYYSISDTIEVLMGNNECNTEYCEEHNIPMYNIYECGGTIVCNKGTIGYATLTNTIKGFRNSEFITAFTEFLKSKNLNPDVNKNDILLDGYKVASCAEIRVLDDLSRIYGVYLISYDVDLEAIQNICRKPMNKIPKGLKDFGLTEDELIIWCNSYFSNIEING